MGFGRPADPRTGNPLAQAVVLSGGTIPPNAQANVAGGLTVYAPAAGGRYDGAAFMVQRSDATTSAITIDGNGVTIDDAATVSMTDDLRLYLFDASSNQWQRAAVPRSMPGFGEPVYVASELPSTPAGWSFASGSTFGMIWSPVDSSIFTSPTSYGLNETYGYYFRNDVAMRLLGVRISSGPTGSGRQFDVGAWNTADPGTQLKAASQVAGSNNEDMRILFATPLTLTAIGNGNRWVVALKCNGAAYVPAASLSSPSGALNNGAYPPPSSWPLYVAPKVMFHCFAWTGGGSLAYPATPIGSIVPALEPILEYS